MLTPQDKENIKEILYDKDRDIVYRDWTRRVKAKLRSLSSLDDDVMNRQIRTLRMRLKDLEGIYTRRIQATSLKALADKYDCSIGTISKMNSKKETGLPVYLNKKYAKENLSFAEANNMVVYMRRLA